MKQASSNAQYLGPSIMQIFDMREYAPAFENMLHDPKQAPIITRRAEPEVCGVRGNDESFFFF
jgi:hypothetical protein